MVNLEHLEPVVCLPNRGYLHTALRNLLYSDFREGSISDYLKNPDNLQNINRKGFSVSDYNQMGAQMEKCRRLLWPSKPDFVAVLVFLLQNYGEMKLEAEQMGLFESDGDLPNRMNDLLNEKADADSTMMSRHYSPDSDIRPDAALAKYGDGVQMAGCLAELVNMFEFNVSHINQLMAEEGTVAQLINNITALHTMKSRVEAGPYRTVNPLYLLFVDDYCGARDEEPCVPMKDPFIKFVDDTFMVNPPIGTDPPRSNEDGPNPWVWVPELETKGLLTAELGKVCVAYDLFGLARYWFSDWFTVNFDDLEIDSGELRGHMETIGYPPVMLTTTHFRNLCRDFAVVLRSDTGDVKEESLAPVTDSRGVPHLDVPPVTEKVKKKVRFAGDSDDTPLWKYLAIGLGLAGIGVLVTD